MVYYNAVSKTKELGNLLLVSPLLLFSSEPSSSELWLSGNAASLFPLAASSVQRCVNLAVSRANPEAAVFSSSVFLVGASSSS